MNKNFCSKCEGCGYMENDYPNCSKCNGIRCENILFKNKYYPYYECIKCFGNGNIQENNIKIICLDCGGIGLIKHTDDYCDSCNSKHKYCFCNYYKPPFVTCNLCDGSGIAK